MPDQGYLYVLANSAMPGLVKVGKTTRTPSERAEELSGVTGLPTPFIVVYEQLFDDCSAAEQFVHTLLESRGFRVSTNREFFNAPVNDVIRAILATPGAATGEVSPRPATNVPDEKERPAWLDLMSQAEQHYYGHGDTLEDHAEALRLYKQAIKLGGRIAFAIVGRMYEEGEGSPKNLEEALYHYKQGANNGDIYCYWCMALLFLNTQNNANMTKCADLFITHKERLHELNFPNIGRDGVKIIRSNISSRTIQNLPNPIKNMFASMKESIKSSALDMVELCEKNPNFSSLANSYKQAVQYIESL
ncbi:GIY-YIG nuclease family protein [Massilia putida]|uniref:GIY-YIG nuclease family protein n=1 Tax=Massilia putida TaxID=1141883 RepID=UPI0009535EF0|nr:GIY-YIG nuclease family protein [Massilia putida]